MKRLKMNPSPQNIWQEAKSVLGKGRGTNLLQCTTNSNPEETAEHQNDFFVKKIATLVADLSDPDHNHEGKKPFKCNFCDLSFELKTDFGTHMDSVHEEKKPCFTNQESSETFSFKYVSAGSVTRIIKRLKYGKREWQSLRALSPVYATSV